MRVIFDTNILVSGVISKGKPNKLLGHVVNKMLDLILSKEVLDEFEDVIKRKKFKLTNEQQTYFISFITELCSLIETVSRFNVIKEDSDDNNILNVAYDGRVDYIVSGDHHLLNLKEFQGIKIVTADRMLNILESEE